jgi:glycosyltransferase involved in cell wall biosynthesis
MNDGMRNGFKHHFPHIFTPYEVIPNGFDSTFWTIDRSEKNEKTTFIAVMSDSQFILKGGDLIVGTALRFENYLFQIAGMQKPTDLATPSNLHFLGKLVPEELRRYYQRSTYFLQLSIFEGFGCALCEAMLCGCIPIGSEVNEIPTIIGDTGYIVKSRSLDELEKVIRQATAWQYDECMATLPRKRVIKAYELEHRLSLLKKVLSN